MRLKLLELCVQNFVQICRQLASRILLHEDISVWIFSTVFFLPKGHVFLPNKHVGLHWGWMKLNDLYKLESLQPRKLTWIPKMMVWKKVDSFEIRPFLVSMLDLWGVYNYFGQKNPGLCLKYPSQFCSAIMC